MKKTRFIITGLLFAATTLVATSGFGAITINKAASVATQQQAGGAAGLLAGNSLIPTALGLVGNVMSMKQQQDALSQECEPTDSEIAFAKTLMQEWARAGGAMPTMTNRAACSGTTYAASVLYPVPGINPCYQRFDGKVNDWQIYKNYPYPAKGYRLKDASMPNNTNNQVIVSDLYEILGKIGFEDADYLPNEVSQMTRLKEKAIRCAPDKLNKKQRELWGNMLTQTIGGLGQNQNAAGTMGQVTQILQNSGGGSPLGAIMNAAPILTGSMFGQ
jgi:hypothetical protein